MVSATDRSKPVVLVLFLFYMTMYMFNQDAFHVESCLTPWFHVFFFSPFKHFYHLALGREKAWLYASRGLFVY